MGNHQQKIVSDEGFIDSIRDLGITTTDAINEFVDNSFDNNADVIWITMDKNEDNNLYMLIEDNGGGISHNEIQKVLAFGGRISTQRVTTGKFGWGLSSSACCQSPRTELYSKTAASDSFYYNYIDLEELKSRAGFLPDTVRKNPFEEYGKQLHLEKSTTSGTILILMHLDRTERKRLAPLVDLVRANLSIVQRKLLALGKSIYLNGEKVKFQDPLMLMDDFDGVEECGKGEDYAEIEPIIFGNIRDEDGNPAKVEIKISKLPVKKIMRKNLQRTAPFNISPETQGFYILRHCRQIAGGQTLHLFTRHPQLNYFRAEISFSPCLDSKFGIQTNKSRFSLDDGLRGELDNRLKKVIAEIRTDIESDQHELRDEQIKSSGPDISISEKIADKARKKLKPSSYVPTKKEEDQVEKEVEKQKQEKIRQIKKDTEIPGDQKEKMIRQIEMAFQRDRIFHRVFETIGTGEFYKIRHKGKRIDVVINQGHDFYRKIYEKATQDPIMQILLDLFLFTLAQAEDYFYDNAEVRSFYNTQRREWSAIMSTFLDEFERELEE